MIFQRTFPWCLESSDRTPTVFSVYSFRLVWGYISLCPSMFFRKKLLAHPGLPDSPRFKFQLFTTLPNIKRLGWNFPCNACASSWDVLESFSYKNKTISKNEGRGKNIVSLMKKKNIRDFFTGKLTCCHALPEIGRK